MADTMKFLWGANSKIPARSNDTNGKTYFAIIDEGYADTAAPTNEAFIYLDKAGSRYNVIAKRAIFDSLGYKIVDKYFTVARNNSSNMLQFFAPSQDVNTATPVGSAAIITAIDLSNSSITANEYKIKTIINGFEDKTTDTNSTLSLNMATGTLAGLMSAEAQEFGGQKTFNGKVIINSDLDVNGAIVTIDGTTSIALAAPTITNTATTSLSITAPTTNITASSALNIVAPTAINGNTVITGTFGVTGVTNIANTTELDVSDANSIKAALKVSGGLWINKKMQVNGIATFANTTDGSSSGGAIVVSGGAKIAKSVYIGNNLTVAGALEVGKTITATENVTAPSFVGRLSRVKSYSAAADVDAALSNCGAQLEFSTTAAAGTALNNDGILLTLGYSTSWGAQIFVDDGSGQPPTMALRSRTATTTWGDWFKVITSGGGTIDSGSLTITTGGKLVLPVRAASYTSSTAGEIWIVA